MDIRKIVKARLKEVGMSQYRLAQKIGMSRQSVSAYLAQRQDLPSQRMGKVLDVLGLVIRPKE